MKKILLSCCLLTTFALFALSFCVLRFGVAETGSAPVIVRYDDEGAVIGELHVTLSRDVADATEKIFGCIKDTARALPFFLTDAVNAVGKEAAGVASLFSSLLAEGDKNDAVAI